MSGEGGETRLRAAPSALPSVAARAVGFAAVLVAAVCGGLVGYALADIGCSGSCAASKLGSAATGALIAAAGVAALAALVLASMSEWADQASASRRLARAPSRSSSKAAPS